MKRNRTRQAYSVLELVISSVVMSLLMIVLGQAMMQAQNSFRNVTGTSESADELRRVSRNLRLELMQTSASQIATGNSCSSLGCPDGQALWFLSNLDAAGKPRYLSDGSPFWLKNVLYYVVVPDDHQRLFGQTCGGGAGPGGYDDRCPHKVLVRKEIDFAGPTNLADDTSVEALMTLASLNPYLLRPMGYQVSSAGQPGLLSAQVAGRNLLSFTLSATMPNTLTIETRSVSIARARTKVALGATSLFTSPFTYQFSLTVVPSIP